MTTNERREAVEELNALLGYAIDEHRQGNLELANEYQARAMKVAKALGYLG